MIPAFFRETILGEVLLGLIIWGVSLLLALSLHPALTKVVKGLTAKTKTRLDDLLLEAISRPLFIFILVQGFFAALTSFTFLDEWQDYVNKAWIIVGGVVIIYGLQRVVGALVKWYGMEIANRTQSSMDDKLLPLVRRFLIVIVYAIGGMIILDNLGIKLSPLLAGLGIGGLAVALALQPTLSNLIASAYMVADGVINHGDFIEMHGGPSGTVIDVGWRSTKIRTIGNNIVIIPNNKLADSIVTNFMAPTPEVGVTIECGVSYESDLAWVEQVALEEARHVIAELPDTVVAKDAQPAVFFRDFGDSNITFLVNMRAKDRPGIVLVQHQLVKRLHARFTREHIEINYPVRKLIYGHPQTNGKAAIAKLETNISGARHTDADNVDA
ncbi:MAG: mechanosensitive ion channel [Dehalococcoidia bacterium]|nr:mechanosensitive ion channel [Dehalococcoidia bacterium]